MSIYNYRILQAFAILCLVLLPHLQQNSHTYTDR
jgi:hypothetical protein